MDHATLASIIAAAVAGLSLLMAVTHLLTGWARRLRRRSSVGVRGGRPPRRHTIRIQQVRRRLPPDWRPRRLYQPVCDRCGGDDDGVPDLYAVAMLDTAVRAAAVHRARHGGRGRIRT